MDEKSWFFHVGPIWFDGTVTTMIIVTCLIVFFLVYGFTRNLTLKPKGKQNAIEWVIDFTTNIVGDNMPRNEVRNFSLFSFTLFMFIFVANQIGLVTKIVSGDNVTYWKSPTANPFVTMGLALLVLTLANYLGTEKLGLGKYIKNSFFTPSALFPIKLMEEFTNVITLGLRLYGNIFAGEVLLSLIASVVTKTGWITLPLVIPLEMIWIAFSLFIGSIQAYVFTTLSMVYISHKIEVE
ncbi:F0F1 ATP synthase subunit A [Enterococcus hermanniensis]|uniref:ATP synthase subunit a n=1 Tax=Enterococcus hermanniensis TaxID=249189 RepID=A0A1L8TNC8_9ENTE|nr:F0F1 ATP synthase subunit A [Enterococcus hermanniensis]OJG45821.1 ATP synthase F0, A subunit [Enterococcus hermanniensis]